MCGSKNKEIKNRFHYKFPRRRRVTCWGLIPGWAYISVGVTFRLGFRPHHSNVSPPFSPIASHRPGRHSKLVANNSWWKFTSERQETAIEAVVSLNNLYLHRALKFYHLFYYSGEITFSTLASDTPTR